jgi:CubicO group peptidase (beta-lactamase class C family)
MLNRRMLVMSALAAATAGATGVRAASADAYEAALDAAFAQTQPVALAGGVVTREGLVWSGVRGVRRFGASDPATLDDRWHLGSNTKAMTAALYGRLVDQGRADWDTPMGDLFPGMKIDPAWEGATLSDFMHHRAGVKDADALGMVFFMTARGDPRPLPEQRRAVVERILGAAPTGTKGAFEYANANYMLVGAAIERITGQPWEEAMQAELFAPLGLSSAGFGAPLTNTAGGANVWGHRGEGPGRTAVDPVDPGADNPAALGPAGTIHMSLGDYGRWLRLFLTDGDGWLKPETIRQLTIPGAGEGLPYALGWIAPPQIPWARGPVLTHDGSNTLWYATAIVAPARGVAFIGLSNQGAGQAATSGLMRNLVATLPG